ncbi:MAG: DUF2442 domain-containing protein [Leptolyngbya sp. SIO4C1]|nr:DUF2442 domain-containing protein [Leptolyngbya sp. SIO4C1]
MKWKAWSQLAQDEIHWQNRCEKGLLKAEPVKDYVLRLWFEETMDVTIYELNFAPLLIDENPGKALLPLRDIKRFQFVKGDYALVWPNPETGEYDENVIDLAPECVRFFCERYGKLVKAPSLAA